MEHLLQVECLLHADLPLRADLPLHADLPLRAGLLQVVRVGLLQVVRVGLLQVVRVDLLLRVEHLPHVVQVDLLHQCVEQVELGQVVELGVVARVPAWVVVVPGQGVVVVEVGQVLAGLGDASSVLGIVAPFVVPVVVDIEHHPSVPDWRKLEELKVKACMMVVL